MAKTITQFRAIQRKDIDTHPILNRLPQEMKIAMKAVSAVLPFRTNNYVVENLIDWNDLSRDPIFHLTIPQEGMLDREDFELMSDLVRKEASEEKVQRAARKIQNKLNPHPAGQMQLNVPVLDGEPLLGMQHKYRETTLFFPSQGQTCHAYCTYCFRWAQFVGIEELKFANREAASLVGYIQQHPEIHDVLFTGGDPMIMKTAVLRRYIEPLLKIPTLNTIRIGTKAPAYWPQRFLSDKDADDLMELFEEVVKAKKHLALMAHFTHPRELETDVAKKALRRILSTGAAVRCQSPIVRHVNNDADAWARMWTQEVRLGAVPYYMFVERNTGPKNYFEIPLVECLEIFNNAYRQVSGLARTVRGPSMSATSGKVAVDGIVEIRGERAIALKMIQGRDPQWVGRVFFAKYDPKASWLNQLKPAFGQKEFFYEKDLKAMKAGVSPHQPWYPPKTVSA